VQAVVATARERAQRRRQNVADAERAYDRFLADVAIPIARQVANVLNVEGYPFSVSTPGRGVRLASERGRDDFIDVFLDTDTDPPAVVGHVRHTRGSRTIDQQRPVKADATPDQISEDELLEFLMRAIEPWMER
jgi:hypothetical protein